MKPVDLAVISTHPIQYYAPIFQTLARSENVRPRVFFTWSQTADAQIPDAGFGRVVSWDIPLLEGYEFEFVPNTARRPGTEHFWGLQNPGLNRAIERWGADAVLVFGWNSAAHLRALLHFKGRIPVFFRGDSTLLDQQPGWRRLARRRLLSWVYRHIDVAIAVGSNNRDYFRWCGVPQDRITFAPHAIDTGRFADPDEAHARRAAELRESLGIAAGARVLLFAGKLIAKKDPRLLLESFLACPAPGHLVFVGNGALESELRQRAAGRPNVHFLPFQNQRAMPAVYRLGDVFVLPSRGPGETWGLAINEAMASGRPVIASSKAGATRDLVLDGVNGWVFESGNLQQLAAAIQDALTCDTQRLRTLGTTAQCESVRWSVVEAAEGIARSVVSFPS
jgi:glycosyltransferase involved in cell wall biosynthesis